MGPPEVRVVLSVGHDAQMDGALTNRIHDLVSKVDDQTNTGVFVGLAEGYERLGEEMFAKDGLDPQPYLGTPLAHGADLPLDRNGLLQHLAAVVVEGTSFGCWLYPAARPAQQLHPETGLERADLLRERGLAEKEQVRGLVQTSRIDGGFESGESAESNGGCGKGAQVLPSLR